MPTKPEVTDIDRKDFTCDVDNDFVIIGLRFTKHVTVDLAETRYKKDHEWVPASQKRTSDASSETAADGTHIRVRAKPRKKDGSKCDAKPLGDLTVTVTNDERSGTSTPSDPKPFDVAYNP